MQTESVDENVDTTLDILITELVVTDDDDNVSAQYTFGGRYEMMKNLYSTVEYVMVDDEVSDSDFLRIAITINF